MWWTGGQDRAVEMLRAVLEGGSPAHAYLLAGPPHTGKATLARELAMALNCAAVMRPCHECRSCQRIEERKHADVQVLSMNSPCDESNERDHDHARRPATVIRLCQVQRLRRVATEAAFEGGWRVFIIEPADLLNNESANAMLKTLEEPASQVVFVLVTAREESVPETVRSRCRRVAMLPMPTAEIAEYLVAQQGLEQIEARALARLARGRLGWALAAARGDGLAKRREVVEALVRLGAARRVDRLAAAADLAKLWGQDRNAVRDTLDVWLEWWRDLLLIAVGQPDLIAHLELRDVALDEASHYTPQQVLAFIDTLRHVQSYLEENVNARLALEVLLSALPSSGERKEGRVALPSH